MDGLNPNSQGERISVREAAEILGTGEEAVRKAMREGRLPHEKDLNGRKPRYSTTREAVEGYKGNRGGRVVAGYSKEAVEQSRELFGKYFGDLQEAIEENTQIGYRRLEAGRKAAEQRDREYEQRERTNELLEKVIEQNAQAGQIMEEIREVKSEGLEEVQEENKRRRSFWNRWFTGGED